MNPVLLWGQDIFLDEIPFSGRRSIKWRYGNYYKITNVVSLNTRTSILFEYPRFNKIVPTSKYTSLAFKGYLRILSKKLSI